MTYRSADSVYEQRIQELRAELDAIAADRRDLETRIEVQARATDARAADLAAHGPGGGALGASLLRIPFLVGGLLLVGALVVPAEIYIGGYIHHQPSEAIVPVLMLGIPGLLAGVIAFPYRRLGNGYASGAVVGAALVFITLAIVFAGCTGVLK